MNKRLINAHTFSAEETLNIAQCDFKSGLTSTEADDRLKEFGPNHIAKGESLSPLKILFSNINNVIVYLLILASAVSFAMGDPVEGIAILVAIIIAVGSGFITELKAQKSIEALQSMVQSSSKVKRDGDIREIPSSELVIGDIIYLEEGDSISADARIVKTVNFAVIESSLTGESEAVDKDALFVGKQDTPLGDRINMIYTGTAVTRGNAYAVVVACGMDTEMGKISSLISNQKKVNTPLEDQLNKLGKTLVVFSVFLAVFLTIVGIYMGYEINVMIKLGIMIAIAAVPESLPAVSTITLAIGMRTMSQRNALVKSLPAVETLGSTTVICTDKTGTLTENQMTIQNAYIRDGSSYEIEGEGYRPFGDVKGEGSLEELKNSVIAGVLCSNASLFEENGFYHLIGDPTEGGIIALGGKLGIDRNDLHNNGYTRILEVPFSSKAKYMATLYELPDGSRKIYCKGAPDVLLNMAGLKDESKEQWLKINLDYATKGMRVLGIGETNVPRDIDTEDSVKDYIKSNLTMLMLVGIMDPPRADVKAAIAEAQRAGIRVIMITGDHPVTALNIAKSIGMNSSEKVITGVEMDGMSEEELNIALMDTSVFARVSPENKLQIVGALNLSDEVTAMTGDGVNDAPALSGADIGIAMGIRGTEVAKEASDMVLTDDRFSTIVDAVKEGRIIYDNIEKFVDFLFSCNIVELIIIFLGIVFLMPMPILPLQILWLNLVIDVMPAMSFAWEHGDHDVMTRKPRNPKTGIANKKFMLRVLTEGSIIAIGAFLAFAYAIRLGYSETVARTIGLSAMAFGQLIHVINVREVRKSGFNREIFRNKFMIYGLLLSSILQIAAVYTPFLNRVVGTAPLNGYHWIWVLLGAAIPTVVIQLKRKIIG